MIDKVIRGIKNPKRAFFRLRDRVLKPVNKESLLDEPIRHFPGRGERLRVFFVKSKYDYGDETRGLSFEENNFLHSLVNSDYEVIAFDPLVAMKKFGKEAMNALLVENVYRWNPDLVFFVMFEDEIEFETLSEIKDNMGIPTLNWFTDDHWRFDSFSKHYAPHLSYVVTTQREALSRYREIGYENVILSQWACNHYLYRKLDLPYKYDVSFIGQPHGDRHRIIQRLKGEGVDVATFGFGWPNGLVSTYNMIKIFNQSKINLNLSNASHGKVNQIKGRDFEIPGCGGFMITGEVEHLSDYFALGSEVVTYGDVSDLIEKTRYYIKHEDERKKIGERGYARVLKEHTYTERFSEIFDRVLGREEGVAL